MHEYSLVAALVDRVEAETVARAGAQVRRVHVCIGELAGVDADLFRAAYETFRGASRLADTELLVRQAEARWECPRCGGAIPRGARLRCATCSVPAILAAGDELVLERIEMEVPDV